MVADEVMWSYRRHTNLIIKENVASRSSQNAKRFDHIKKISDYIEKYGVITYKLYINW